uniref:Uncharacterized protein n=1 Tax=Glossina brevipalpis TaxID=37001 RepID=A0A1A9WTR2_9MUSC
MLKRHGVLISKIIRCARYVSGQHVNYTDDSVVPIDSKTLFMRKTSANILELEKQLYSLEQTERLTEQITETAAIVRQLAQTTLKIQEKERQRRSFGALEPELLTEKENMLNALNEGRLSLEKLTTNQREREKDVSVGNAAKSQEDDITQTSFDERLERNDLELERKQTIMEADTEDLMSLMENVGEASTQEKLEPKVIHTEQEEFQMQQKQMIKEDQESDFDKDYLFLYSQAALESVDQQSLKENTAAIPINNFEEELKSPETSEIKMTPKVLYTGQRQSDVLQNKTLKPKLESEMEEDYMLKTELESNIEEQQMPLENAIAATRPLYNSSEKDLHPLETLEFKMEPKVMYTAQRQPEFAQKEMLKTELESDIEDDYMLRTDIESDTEEQTPMGNAIVATRPFYNRSEKDLQRLETLEFEMEPKVMYTAQRQPEFAPKEMLKTELESDIEEDYMLRTDIESDTEEQTPMENAFVTTNSLDNNYETKWNPAKTLKVKMEPRIMYREQEQSKAIQEETLKTDLESDIGEEYMLKTEIDSDIEEQQSSMKNNSLYNNYENDVEPVATLKANMATKMPYTEQKLSAMTQEQMFYEDAESDREELSSPEENNAMAAKFLYKKYDSEGKPIESLEAEVKPEAVYNEQKYTDMYEQQLLDGELESDIVEEYMLKEDPKFDTAEEKSPMENAFADIKETRKPFENEIDSRGDKTKTI